jgi:Tol biopolymer transport system component
MRILIFIVVLIVLWFPATGQAPKGKVIFSSQAEQNGAIADLYEINSDGSNERKITASDKDNDLPSVFNNRIAYRQVEDRKGTASLIIIGTNGEGGKALIEHKFVCAPKLASDGKLIAYENYTEKGPEIWVMDTNGHSQRRLIKNARHPNWDGNDKMFFSRELEIYSLNIKNGKEKQLTHLKPTGISCKFPAISPDEKKLAFAGFDQKRDGKGDIYIMDLKQKGKPRMIEDCDIPCWTNDPKYIVCSCRSKEHDSWQIAMVNVETGKKIFITNNKRSNFFPVWVK